MVGSPTPPHTGPPDGIITGKSPFLVPDKEPIVFRTFLDGVSAHAIMVGFPQRSHVVFDANRVRLVQAWAGDFISPASAWEGRGGNYAKVPSSDIVASPAGPPLAVLESQSLPWPKDVPQARMGTRRTPPGWRYRGYSLDDQGVPTFLDTKHTIETAADAEAYLSRLDAFATVLDQNTDKFREDTGKGVLPPDFLLDTTLAQVQALNVPADKSGLVASLANRAKAAFLAAMSHELKTPLNAVLGFSEIIRDEILGADAKAAYRDYAADIHASGRRLLAVINDVLDVSRLEGGQLTLDARPSSAQEIAELAVAMARSTSSTKIFSPPEFTVTESRPSSSIWPSARCRARSPGME